MTEGTREGGIVVHPMGTEDRGKMKMGTVFQLFAVYGQSLD